MRGVDMRMRELKYAAEKVNQPTVFGRTHWL